MRAIVCSDDALRDLDRAIGFIAQDNERAATGVLDRVEAAVALLAERPIGRPGRVAGTYEKLVSKTSYIVSYSLAEQELTILHVIHARRNWPDDCWPADE